MRKRSSRLAVGCIGMAALLLVSPATSQPAVKAMIGGYDAQKLRANFLLEWMSIPGFTFWGARITSLEPGSPLAGLGLIEGDVVTRLDGIRVSRGKWWNSANGGYFMLPQMERHYGKTQVRYIKSGTTIVRNGYIDLGPLNGQPMPGGGGIAP